MAFEVDRQGIDVTSELAMLAAVHLPDSRYDERDPLGELRALAESAGAEVVGEITQRKQKPESGTFMGTGKLKELKAACEMLHAGVIIFDNQLSPKQIANIERITERKVLDRCELILDIFAGRATTKQARLAVEYAQLEYTYPRLRAMWTHLERIVGVGGIGGVGTRGPGEQQLEIDRRLVQQRKVLLRRELAQIHERKEREVASRSGQHFTVGLVGYTNAGKSTLFNTLTAGGAYADDRVFATLTSRTREWDLGNGISAMLSDTVGFIRDLPHRLVEPFKATLEEATRANLLLVVLDASDPACELQYQTVLEVLEDLYEDARAASPSDQPYAPPEHLLLLNKADQLPDNSELLVWTQRHPDAIPLCSLTVDGVGQDELSTRVRSILSGAHVQARLRIPLSQARAFDYVERVCEVLDRDYSEAGFARVSVVIGQNHLDRVSRMPGVTWE